MKSSRPRISTHRTRRLSSSPFDTVAYSSQLTTPGHPRADGNGIVRNPRDRDTPSGSASAPDLLRHVRESPGPLEIVLTVTTNTAVKLRSGPFRITSGAETKPTKSYAMTCTTRRSDHDLTAEAANTVKVEIKKSTSAPSTELRAADATLPQRKRKRGQIGSEPHASAQTGDESRLQRSAHSDSRYKTELAHCFYNHEQLISLEDPKPGEYSPLFAHCKLMG